MMPIALPPRKLPPAQVVFPNKTLNLMSLVSFNDWMLRCLLCGVLGFHTWKTLHFGAERGRLPLLRV